MNQQKTVDHQVFPPFARVALMRAARLGDCAMIDAVTDDLVRQGLCRPRHDNVMPSRAEVARGVAAVRGMARE
jgi:hypothetical protein